MLLLFFFLLLYSLSFSEDVVVARVDGRIITKSEFVDIFNFYWKEVLHLSPKKPTLEDKKLFLYEYIKGLIVEDLSDKMGIRIEEKELVKRLKRWGRRKPSQEILSMARRELLVEKLTERLSRDVVVTENEIRTYYLLNKREFYYPNQVKLLRVLVDSRERARKVYKQLKRGRNIHPAPGVRVGRERWYSIQALPKRVRRRLFPYRVGVVSKPIKLETGYLILKITDKRKAGLLPLEEVREKVRKKLLKIKRQEVLREWFKHALKNYRLEIYLKNLE
jgi:parvulin-like peptidyl-prolyl isomerase